jgi:hypothetical protein
MPAAAAVFIALNDRSARNVLVLQQIIHETRQFNMISGKLQLPQNYVKTAACR